MKIERIQRFALWLGLICGVMLIISSVFSLDIILKPLAVVTAIALAIGIASLASLKSYQYTARINHTANIIGPVSTLNTSECGGVG